jgi:hypothetical protein
MKHNRLSKTLLTAIASLALVFPAWAARRSQQLLARRAESLPGARRLSLLLGLLLLAASCDVKTLLLANFNSDTIGLPPGQTQDVGTVSLDPGDGTITVVAAPTPSLPPDKWAWISHPKAANLSGPEAPSPGTALRCNFVRAEGDGSYGMRASLYIPSGAQVVTVDFEPWRAGTRFLHLDFMPEGDVMVDDRPDSRFGSFPRDQEFILTVSLDITSTTATAHIDLLGAGASGSSDVSVQPDLIDTARQFGAVRFWVSFQFKGSFFVDNVLVTHKTS